LKGMNMTDMNILKHFGVKHIKSNVYCFQILLALISYHAASTFTKKKKKKTLCNSSLSLLTSFLASETGDIASHTAIPTTASF